MSIDSPIRVASIIAGVFLSGVFSAAGMPEPQVMVPAGPFKPDEKIELTVTNLPPFSNPFNPAAIQLDAEIVSSDGKPVRVPGFAALRCEERQVQGETRYIPTQGMDWHIRYAAPSAGDYQGKVTVTVPNGSAVSQPFHFRVIPTTVPRKGNVRVAPGNPRAFAFEDGSSFIPIGENLGWQTPRDRLFDWIAKLGANGANWTRVWTSNSPTFGIEGVKAFEYKEDAARGIDTFVQTCEQNGVYAMLCLNHARNFGPPPRPPGEINYTTNFPYDVHNGGPAANMKEMFSLPAARVQQQAMLRYVIARWGYSRAVFAWELWNEMDSIRDNSSMKPEIIDWVKSMCDYLHAHDPYHHLTTTSLGSTGIWDDLWKLPTVDFINYHDYGGRERYKNLSQVDVFAPVMEKLDQFDKPVLFSEVGLVNEKWGPNVHVSPKEAATAVQDTGNVAFHEALWLPFFTGSAGGGMHWWWEEFDQYNVYPLYLPLARFVADIPLARGPLPTVVGKVTTDELRCFARGNDWGTVAWVWDSRSSWQAIVLEGEKPATMTGVSVLFPAARGTFQVMCMNTRTGKEISRQVVKADDKGLNVPLPNFEVDVAVEAKSIR